MWIERQIENLLLHHAATRPMVLLTGARQTGKTSLMQKLFPDHGCITLDLPSEAEQAERDPHGFLARLQRPVIIDEIQRAPRLLHHIETKVDQHSRNGSFLLTGSRPLTSMGIVPDSLAGHAGCLELEPLTFQEVASAYPDITVEEFLVRGGYPELYADRKIDTREFFQSYLATYLKRDLWHLLNVSSLLDFERFVRAVALRSTRLLNQADLARDIGVSGSTLSTWLAVLQASHQLVLLKPWQGKPGASKIKRPKPYMCDAGLASFLCGVHCADDLRTSPLARALWETLVSAEIRRSQINQLGCWNLNFWRDRSREANFLVQQKGLFHLADAKWTTHPSSRDVTALNKVKNIFPADAVKSLSIVCRTPNAYPLTEDVIAAPVDELPTAFLGD